jgi:hypothetical protein
LKLPFGGYRKGDTTIKQGSAGYAWTTSVHGNTIQMCEMEISGSKFASCDSGGGVAFGQPVRCFKNLAPTLALNDGVEVFLTIGEGWSDPGATWTDGLNKTGTG